jgi:hypothetical protein
MGHVDVNVDDMPHFDVNAGFDANIIHIPITATLEQFLSIVNAQAPLPIPSLQVSHLITFFSSQVNNFFSSKQLVCCLMSV